MDNQHNSDGSISLHVGERERLVTRPLLIAVLVAALLTGGLGVLRRFAPDGPWLVMFALIFFAALEGVYTTQWLADPDQRTTHRLGYRLAEILVLLLIVRFLVWQLFGSWPQLSEIRQYLLQPSLFLDPLFVLFTVLALVAWAQAISFTGIFVQLRFSRDEAAYFERRRSTHSATADARPLVLDRSGLVAQYLHLWIIGGFLLVLAAALTTFDLAVLDQGFSLQNIRTIGRLGLPPEILIALLVYFLVGFWLLSEARLRAMEGRWLTNGIVTNAGVPRSWQRSSLLLLLGVALLAAFLPIGSTLGLARILEVFFLVGTAISGLLFFLLHLLLAMLLTPFLGTDTPAAEPQPLPPMPPLPPAAAPLSETSSLVLGGIFWLIVLIVTLLAVIFFLHGRGYPLHLSLLHRIWEAATGWWRLLWQNVEEGMDNLSRTLRARLVREVSDESGAGRWRFIRVNALPPREQIRFFYLAAVRRAGERGVIRQESETPLEYAEDLKTSWPEAEVDMEQLTQAFLKARYSRQVIADDDLGLVKRTWARVKSTLRKRRKADQPSEQPPGSSAAKGETE